MNHRKYIINGKEVSGYGYETMAEKNYFAMQTDNAEGMGKKDESIFKTFPEELVK